MGYQKYHEEDDDGWADIHTVDGKVTRVDVYRYDDSSRGHSHVVYGQDGGGFDLFQIWKRLYIR